MHPHDASIGEVFEWKGRMWRRGRGKIYVAHPQGGVIGIIAEGFWRRWRKRGNSMYMPRYKYRRRRAD
jgi:hypothetical protein